MAGLWGRKYNRKSRSSIFWKYPCVTQEVLTESLLSLCWVLTGLLILQTEDLYLALDLWALFLGTYWRTHLFFEYNSSDTPVLNRARLTNIAVMWFGYLPLSFRVFNFRLLGYLHFSLILWFLFYQFRPAHFPTCLKYMFLKKKRVDRRILLITFITV